MPTILLCQTHVHKTAQKDGFLRRMWLFEWDLLHSFLVDKLQSLGAESGEGL